MSILILIVCVLGTVAIATVLCLLSIWGLSKLFDPESEYWKNFWR